MRHIPRELERQILKAAKVFPAVVLTGPRGAGKTWLLRRLRALVWRDFLKEL